MKMTALVLTPLVFIGAGCTTMPPSAYVANVDLPNCYDSNYSEQQRLFTISRPNGNIVNQQCLLTVLPRGNNSSGRQLAAGTYSISASNGGGGGAGGTIQSGTKFPGVDNSGGGGGGGAGAAETTATVNLTEGAYRLTLGAGGPGGSACSGPPEYFSGGPGWAGSPTNMVRVGTGEVVFGTAGAETYVRPSRWQHERNSGKPDGSGGYGPGQTSGGDGATFNTSGNIVRVASAGEAKPGAIHAATGGEPGKVLPKDQLAGPGGGGGASSAGVGGTGGGDLPRHVDIAPTRGTLGSGGGGGAGDSYGCAPGASGGHGFIAFVRT
jgi:hypothetical protein